MRHLHQLWESNFSINGRFTLPRDDKRRVRPLENPLGMPLEALAGFNLSTGHLRFKPRTPTTPINMYTFWTASRETAKRSQGWDVAISFTPSTHKGPLTMQDAVRSEAEILADLKSLCREPGYVHAIAWLCLRDNIISFKDAVQPEDMLRLFTSERLVRTEISTLIGLLAKGPIDYTLPTRAKTQEQADRSDALLLDLHNAMSASMMRYMQGDHQAASLEDIFNRADVLREPIFYGGEAAYSFQYRDFAAEKYAADEPWFITHKGFSIEDAVRVARAIVAVQNRKALSARERFKEGPPDDWSPLETHVFSPSEVAIESGLTEKMATNVLDALTYQGNNEAFESVGDFNATNAAPIFRVRDDAYLALQYYSVVEAVYESPYFWMLRDEAYASTASGHRGKFTENFASRRLGSVFGADRVHQNVDLVPSKGKRLGEIDVLVEYGDRLIIVQAKSKRLTIEARNPPRHTPTFEE